MSDEYVKALLNNVRLLREKAGVSAAELEEKMILGPGWVTRIEQGLTVPSVDMLVAIVRALNFNLSDLLADLPQAPEDLEVERQIYAEQNGNDLDIHFRYANHDAVYTLAGASEEEFDEIIRTLRDGLARLNSSARDLGEAIKTDSVATSFLKAVSVWPSANPSDLWWFVVYRAYCDPFNHPSTYARLDFTQSWKRTGGWALEEVLVKHYSHFLSENGVRLFIPSGAESTVIVNSIDVGDRIEADKIDIALAHASQDLANGFFGVVHVKASFAERRTDDVPMSTALSRAGYTSPLWTMDCKSTPADRPVNKGELGLSGRGRVSAKRRDIEDEGYFTGCFSYNSNTVPSNNDLPSERRIHTCNFNDPDDTFAAFILERARTSQMT